MSGFEKDLLFSFYGEASLISSLNLLNTSTAYTYTSIKFTAEDGGIVINFLYLSISISGGFHDFTIFRECTATDVVLMVRLFVLLLTNIRNN